MVKVMAVEVSASVPPLPYIPVPATAGLVTVTWTAPELEISEAGILAVSSVALM